MRAIVMRRVGGPEVLELEEVPAPSPKPGEVLVEIHAVGVNFADTEWRRARYRPTPLPWILGSEGAGVVVETGAGVDAAWHGRVLGTVSSVEKADAVREAGGEPLLYGEDLVERVRALTDGRGVDVVLDSIGLPTQAASLAMLAPYGELVHFGDAGGFPAPVDPDDLYARSLKVSAFGLDERHDPQAAAQARRDLVSWAVDGSLRFRIGRTLPLVEAAQAHRLLESRGTIGKLVLIR